MDGRVLLERKAGSRDFCEWIGKVVVIMFFLSFSRQAWGLCKRIAIKMQPENSLLTARVVIALVCGERRVLEKGSKKVAGGK